MAWGVGFSSPQRSRRLFYNAIPARERRWKESGMRMPKQTRTQTLDENKRTHWRCLAEAPARPSASAPWCGFSPCEELSSANGRARARASARQGDFRVAGRLPHLHARGRVAGLRHETNAILRLKARRARVARVRATDYRAVNNEWMKCPAGGSASHYAPYNEDVVAVDVGLRLVVGHLPDSFSPRVTSPGGTNACLVRRGRAAIVGDDGCSNDGDDEPPRPRELDTTCALSSTASSTQNSFGSDAIAALSDVSDAVTLDRSVWQLELVYNGTTP